MAADSEAGSKRAAVASGNRGSRRSKTRYEASIWIPCLKKPATDRVSILRGLHFLPVLLGRNDRRVRKRLPIVEYFQPAKEHYLIAATNSRKRARRGNDPCLNFRKWKLTRYSWRLE